MLAGQRHRATVARAQDRLEIEGHVARGLESLLAALLQAMAHQPLESRRYGHAGSGDVRRVFLEDRSHAVRRGLPGERALPRQHLVEHRTKREDVRSSVGRLSAHLLGRHVASGAENGSRIGGARERWRAGVVVRGRGVRAREAEVQDLDPPVAGQEDVLRLQVPVDDALLVRGREPVRQLRADLDGLAQGQRAALQALPQSLPFQQLHHGVGASVMRAKIVDGEDVRMG